MRGEEEGTAQCRDVSEGAGCQRQGSVICQLGDSGQGMPALRMSSVSSAKGDLPREGAEGLLGPETLQ